MNKQIKSTDTEMNAVVQNFVGEITRIAEQRVVAALTQALTNSFVPVYGSATETVSPDTTKTTPKPRRRAVSVPRRDPRTFKPRTFAVYDFIKRNPSATISDVTRKFRTYGVDRVKAIIATLTGGRHLTKSVDGMGVTTFSVRQPIT